MIKTIGILIVTHGNLSRELVESCKLFCGEPDHVRALCLNPADDIGELRARVSSEVDGLDRGEGVLVFVDLFGGSPSNCAAANMKNQHFECLTGVNLPMLIEALNGRDHCVLEELAERCMKAGSNGILNLRHKIAQRKAVS